MEGFLEALEGLETKKDALVCIVTEGPDKGEKLLLSGGEPVWETPNGAFLRVHSRELAEKKDSGLFLLEGQTIYAEWLGDSTRLVICGGGHVSLPIIRLGCMLGYEVTVIEDRPQFAANAEAAGAHRVICRSFEEALEEIPGDEDTCFVIVTRGHRYDELCLAHIAGKSFGYIGMMGSKRRIATVREHALEQGADPAVVGALHAPIGLPLGGETPEEIAVSILAEIIGVRNEKKRSQGYLKDIRKAIRDEACPGSRVLATIISRKGSAPRSIGTKMLIQGDGSCVGTIGGGCMEAEVRKRALWLLHHPERKLQVCRVDLCASDAEEEGMVCGGVLEVLLEKIESPE